MCGIIGVLGDHEAAPILVDALKRLEYRGYDSAGIATVNDGVLDRRRAVGKLVNLSDLLVHEPLAGKAGIGHTRWATHGAPNVGNAHPHKAGPVAVVHNGIIENFRELREELQSLGLSAETDTDTEVIALLAQHHLAQTGDPKTAAEATLTRLEGAFALCLLFEGLEDLLICARKGSPLAIGYGAGEMFVGSDAIALAPLTDKIAYLDEGDYAIITRAGAQIFDADGNQTHRDIKTVEIGTARIDKGGHKHFMAKEIAEQPTLLAELIAHYLSPDNTITLPDALDFTEYDRVLLVACGTGYYACKTAKHWFEQVSGLPVEVDVASEYRYREPPVGDRTLALYLSQSGETADTLAALRYTAGKAKTIAAIVNVPESSIAREADVVLQIRAGVEVSVASTKAFTNQLTILLLMAAKAAQDRGRPLPDGLFDGLRALPGLLNIALDGAPEVARISRGLAEARDVLFLGRGAVYPIALEGALKLKEISYIHAEGYAAGELKHGPIALVDKHVPVIVLAPRDRLFDKTVSNMQEVLARGGKVVLVSDDEGIAEFGDDAWCTLTLPRIAPALAPILYTIPVQLLAYHTAVAKGTDVDQPRNLAKSVTVE